MSHVEWADPPPQDPPEVEAVKEELRTRPGKWARIAKGQSLGMFESFWWEDIVEDPEFETLGVMVTVNGTRGRDIYAKFKEQS